MKLLYGTANPAKLRHMQEMLEGMGLTIVGLHEVERTGEEEVEETGGSPLDNAWIKAEAYYRSTGLPVFSCDSGLYLEGVAPGEQPGVRVRRVGGKVFCDEEMIGYYAGLAAKYGGQLRARYRNAIALILDGGTSFAYDGDDIASQPFQLVSEPHPLRNPGYPLDTISVDPSTGKYFIERERERYGMENAITLGYRGFFERSLVSLRRT